MPILSRQPEVLDPLFFPLSLLLPQPGPVLFLCSPLLRLSPLRPFTLLTCGGLKKAGKDFLEAVLEPVLLVVSPLSFLLVRSLVPDPESQFARWPEVAGQDVLRIAVGLSPAFTHSELNFLAIDHDVAALLVGFPGLYLVTRSD